MTLICIVLYYFPNTSMASFSFEAKGGHDTSQCKIIIYKFYLNKCPIDKYYFSLDL